MKYITFDLETLGNTTRAPIVQIGAVKFNDKGEIGDTFIRSVKPSSIDKYDFVPDYGTIYWWLNQDKEAIQSVFGEDVPKTGLKHAIQSFIKWIGKTGDYTYWSHATFDPPILINHFKELDLGRPIPFRLYRDIRTLTHFSGKIESTERKGVHHNALDDAKYQATYISKAIQSIS